MKKIYIMSALAVCLFSATACSDFLDREPDKIMTDDQIRERAAELGMVDSSELTLAALQNSAKQPTEGTPEEIARNPRSHTGRFLSELIRK